MKLILSITFLVLSLYFFRQSSKNSSELIKEVRSYQVNKQAEIDELKAQNLRLRHISIKLFNYSDYKQVKRDTSLVNTMIKYSSNED